ncbi:MAG: DUF3667 domain-containing protein [Hyphomonadaceae bacterium]|nr:DUF3667 domain-containing protein [Hyphomonadaceae bacterium]
MSGEIEAAGAMATAGLAAGAIETHEAREGGHGACLNCGAELSGNYCAACGQAAHAHRTLAQVFEEALHGILHFDTKIWRTLPMVIGRPGTLTRNYVYGKRARYISPLALFLFCIFLMFFVFAFMPEDVVEASARADAEVASAPTEDGASSVEHGEAQTWQDELKASARSGDLQVNLGAPDLNERVRHAAENPDLALYKVQNAAYKFSFLLLPISLPFIWLLFAWKRGLTLYDHAVYALYALSFASLMFITVVLAAMSSWTSWATGWLLGLGLPAHTFFHLKGAYALGWFSALWRTAFMLCFALVSLLIFVAVILVLGLVG